LLNILRKLIQSECGVIVFKYRIEFENERFKIHLKAQLIFNIIDNPLFTLSNIKFNVY